MERSSNDKHELLQCLCLYGNYEHRKGLQVVDYEAALTMKKDFYGFCRKKIPIFIGHLDELESFSFIKKHKKDSIEGYIKEFIVDQRGIWVLVEYNKESTFEQCFKEELLMSPRWRMEVLSDGKYRPVELLSIALTGKPNIYCSGRLPKIITQKDFNITFFGNGD